MAWPFPFGVGPEPTGNQHRYSWPGSLSTSGGASAWHFAWAYGHRGAKRQPLGGSTSCGGRPGMACRRAWRGSSSLGIERSSASVYGMRTLRNSVAVGAFSTIWPAYMTAMSSARPATTPRSWVTRIMAMFRSRC